MDKETQGNIEARLDKVDSLVSDIRGDWTDPRYECREIWRILKEIRGLLADYRKLPKDKPPLLKRNLALTGTGNMVAQREADIKFYEENNG